MHQAVRAKRFVSVLFSKNHNACFSRIVAVVTDAVSPGPYSHSQGGLAEDGGGRCQVAQS